MSGMTELGIVLVLMAIAGLFLLALYMCGVPGWFIIGGAAILLGVPAIVTTLFLIGAYCNVWLRERDARTTTKRF